MVEHGPPSWRPAEGRGIALDFAIVGAQKSASTFLHQRLADHAAVTMPRQESRHFEDPDYSTGAFEELGTYLAAHRGTCNGIKRPDYLAKPEVAPRLAEHVPGLRIMAVLREPVARALSAYYHLAGFGFVPVLEPNAAMTAVLDGTMQKKYPKAQEILDYGMYALHLRRWQTLFPPEQFLVLRHDDVAKDPATSLRRALQFLELPEMLDAAKLAHQANPGVYWSPRVAVRSARSKLRYDYDVVHGKANPRQLGPVRWTGVAALTILDKGVLRRFHRDTRPRLRPDVHARLGEYYAADVAQLQPMLGLDLSAWRADA